MELSLYYQDHQDHSKYFPQPYSDESYAPSYSAPLGTIPSFATMSSSAAESGDSSSTINTANLSLLSAAASQRAAALEQLKRPTTLEPPPTEDKNVIEAKKRSLTLDFTSPESAKKTLQTPDVLRFLQLTSPELEKFLTQGAAVVTTPTPTQFLFPKNVTAQQEQYARGFIDALGQLHQVHGFVPPGNLLSPGFVVTPGAKQAGTNPLIGDKAGTAAASSSSSFIPTGLPNDGSAAAVAAALAVSSKLQSPTRPESSLASVIMQSVAFPGMTSQQFFSGAGTVAASMALLNQSLKLDQAKTHILAELADRPPSQSAPPGSMEFTNLTPQPASTSPAIVGSTATSSGGLVMVGGPSSSYLEVNTASTRSLHASPSPRSYHHSPYARVKQEPYQEDGTHSLPSVLLNSGPGSNSLDTDGYSGRSLASGSSASSLMDPNMDPETQDQMKLERKRARNRQAATKCRKRKLERIEVLEKEVSDKKIHLSAAAEQVERLKLEIRELHNTLESHKQRGCSLGTSVTTIMTSSSIVRK